jgi:hypothetical protein
MPDTDNGQLTVSEVDLNNVLEQPRSTNQVESLNYDDAVVVAPQEVNDDIITITIKDDELPDAVLKAVLLGLAEEQQALKDLRVKKTRENKDVSRICLQRGTLLKYMSETLIQRQALGGGSGEIDLKSPKFREVIKMFLGVISETFDEARIPQEFKDIFFNKLGYNLEGWEIKAEKFLKTMH